MRILKVKKLVMELQQNSSPLSSSEFIAYSWKFWPSRGCCPNKYSLCRTDSFIARSEFYWRLSIIFFLSHHPQCRNPIRLHCPIPELNARPFPLREKTCTNLTLQNISTTNRPFLVSGFHGAHKKPRLSSVLYFFIPQQTHGFCTAPRRGFKMVDKNEDNEFRLEDLEDLTCAEFLDPLGELQSKKPAPKPQVSKRSTSKRKATLLNVSTDKQTVLMEGLKTLQD